MSETSKRNHALSLEEKINIIELKEKNTPVKTICEIYKCGKTQVYEAIKKKVRLREEWQKGNVNRKRRRFINYDDVDKLTWEWFVNARSKNMSVTGTLLREKAKEIAERLDKTDFKASNGWLISFKNRHGIKPNQIIEADDASDEKIVEWKNKLPVLICDYKPQDIYSCGECGIFYKALPTRILIGRDEECNGGKHAKERITMFLCCNMEGDMEKPLIISKAQIPKHKNNIDHSSLPVIWKFDKKSWMTSAIMEEWLRSFNARMKSQNRNVLLFLDNEACHPNLELSNIKLQFLPNVRTAETQPLEQGIIFTVKMLYRMLMLQSLISATNSENSLFELAKKITVLDVMIWVSKACEKIPRDTIKKSFMYAGFPFDENVEDEMIRASFQEFDALMYDSSYLLGSTEISSVEYIRADGNLKTNAGMGIIEDMLEGNKYVPVTEESSSEDDESANVQEGESTISSYVQAVETIKQLQTFFMKEGNSDLLSISTDLQIAAEKNVVLRRRFKQISILGYCNPVNVCVNSSN